MTPCHCGHWHAVTCWECGCTTYEAAGLDAHHDNEGFPL